MRKSIADKLDDYYLYLRNVNGKSIYYVRYRSRGKLVTRSTGTGNIKDAHKFAAQEVAKVPQSGMTLEAFAAPFYTDKCPHIAHVKRDGETFGIKQTSLCYNILHKKILKDDIRFQPLKDLSRYDVVAFLDRLILQYGERDVVNKTMHVLKSIIKEAVYQNLILANPCDQVNDIKTKKKERKPLTLEQWVEILKISNWDVPVYWRATATAALTGMRAGEVRALTWGQLNPDKGTIYVNRALLQLDSKVKLPKCEKIRTTIYPSALQSILEPLRAKDDELIFINPLTKKVIGYNAMGRAYAKAAKKAKAEGTTLHCLRHTLNTMMLNADISPEKVRAIFGWSAGAVVNGQFINTSAQVGYTHVDQFDISKQTALVDSLLGQ